MTINIKWLLLPFVCAAIVWAAYGVVGKVYGRIEIYKSTADKRTGHETHR